MAAVALVLASVAEFAPGDIRGDGDNPADGLEYLHVASRFYAYSGAAFVAGGAALVTGVIGMALAVLRSRLSLPYASASAFGVLAGGFLVLNGLLRLQATGTVQHIAGLRASWGESAYLVVQIAGTQGALSAAVVSIAGWLLATAILAWRRRVGWLVVVGVPPFALFLLYIVDVVVPDWEFPDGLFLVYIGAITIGLPLGLALAGLALLLPGMRDRLGSVPSGRAGRLALRQSSTGGKAEQDAAT
ncbi:MAG: hypothetical protein ABI566_02040 [Pseudolysinimonas sp.]